VQVDLARVLQPVHRPERDVDRLVLGHQPHLLADGDPRRALDHHPVLGAVHVALQRQDAARVHHDPLHLEAAAERQRLVPAPGPVEAREVGRLPGAGLLQQRHRLLDPLAVGDVGDEHRVAHGDRHDVAQADADQRLARVLGAE
jgi:hypothetical protein